MEVWRRRRKERRGEGCVGYATEVEAGATRTDATGAEKTGGRKKTRVVEQKLGRRLE